MKFELPIVSSISALLVLIPLPWHWKTRNVCTASGMLWLAACNIIRATNTFIWRNDDVVRYKIWCDIVSRVEIGANIGVPAATVCICRRLAHATSSYHGAPSPGEVRQRVKFEIGMCIVLPIIFTGLNVIVESCRFGIMKGFGCSMCYYPSVPSLFIQQVPAILLSWASLIYSGVTLRWLIHRHVQFRQAQNTGLTPASGRYLRLVALVITQMTFASIMTLFLLTTDMYAGINPWTSWEDVHKNWKEIYIASRDSMPEMYWVVAMVGWYFVPIASITTFGHFGFDDRVIAEYRSMFAWTKAHTFGIKVRKAVVLPLSTNATHGDMGLGNNAFVIDIGGRSNVSTFDSSESGSGETQ